MSNFFYYFGFLYIGDLIRSLWIQYKPVKEEEITNIDARDGIASLLDKKDKINSDFKSNKTTVSIIIGALFFSWAIIGYVSNTPEKHLFLLDIIAVILYWIFLLTFSIIFVMVAVFGSKHKIHNNNKKEYKIHIPAKKIILVSEFIIVSMILYYHFFINQI